MNIDEIRARTAKKMQEMQKRAEEAAEKIKIADADEEKRKAEEEESARRAAELNEANLQRQREVLAQMMGEEFAKQSAAMQEQVSEEIKRQAEAVAAQAQQDVLGALYGGDLSMLSAALDTYAMMGGEDDEEEEEAELTPAQFYEYTEEKMREVDALEEPQPAEYGALPSRWEKFCILLSGIISTVNGHSLDKLDVEEHIPLYEQQIANLMRNSWGICGREELLDTLLYLSRGGYRARFAAYAEAASPEELFNEETDEEDKEGIRRGWAFVQHFKDKYDADFLLGWDIGRAAMITRWGYFVGWLTKAETLQLLSDMGQVAAGGLDSWREFARSYLFGGAFWKEVCAAYDGASYLGTLADAVKTLLGKGNDGQWRCSPWAKA